MIEIRQTDVYARWFRRLRDSQDQDIEKAHNLAREL